MIHQALTCLLHVRCYVKKKKKGKQKIYRYKCFEKCLVVNISLKCRVLKDLEQDGGIQQPKDHLTAIFSTGLGPYYWQDLLGIARMK